MTDMGFWKDDALICMEYIQKMYSDEPGIRIGVYDDISMDMEEVFPDD
jgi:Holliday junction resolvase RusA-like endonuclease